MARQKKEAAMSGRFVVLCLLALAVSLSGCASIISEAGLKGADLNITPVMVQSEPEKFVGRKVVWGGIILGIEHKEKTSIVEVFQTELTSMHEPTRDVPRHGGARFLIESPGFLDDVIFSAKKGITAVGTVIGIRKKKIDEMEYPYPVVSPVEMKLVDLSARDYEVVPPPYPYVHPYSYPYYDPYWPYYWPYYHR